MRDVSEQGLQFQEYAGYIHRVLQDTTHTTYPRYLFLGAYDGKTLRQSNGQDAVEVWNTAVVSTGSSDDLRAVMPIMIAAAADYFGGNTGRKIKKTMLPGNRKVKWGRGESPAP